jgi:hypothetical protein
MTHDILIIHVADVTKCFPAISDSLETEMKDSPRSAA